MDKGKRSSGCKGKLMTAQVVDVNSSVSSSSSVPSPRPLTDLRNSLNTILNMMDTNVGVDHIYASHEGSSIMLDVSDNLQNQNQETSSATQSLSDTLNKSENAAKIDTRIQEGKAKNKKITHKETKKVRYQSSIENALGSDDSKSCEVNVSATCTGSLRNSTPQTTTTCNGDGFDMFKRNTSNVEETSESVPVVIHHNAAVKRQRGGSDGHTCVISTESDATQTQTNTSSSKTEHTQCPHKQTCCTHHYPRQQCTIHQLQNVCQCPCTYQQSIPGCAYKQSSPPCTCAMNTGERHHTTLHHPTEVPNGYSDYSIPYEEEYPCPCTCPRPSMKSRFKNMINNIGNGAKYNEHEVRGQFPKTLVFDLVEGIPEKEKTEDKKVKEKKWQKKCQLTSAEGDQDRVDVYYFDHGNSGYYRTTDRPPHVVTELFVEQTEYFMSKFWANVFGTLHIVFTFIMAFVLQFIRFILGSIIRPLIVGIIQLPSDYFFKPLLAILFNGIIQPIFIMLYNVATSLKDLCEPIAHAIGFFIREVAVLVHSARLVEVCNTTYVHQPQAKQSSKRCPAQV